MRPRAASSGDRRAPVSCRDAPPACYSGPAGGSVGSGCSAEERLRHGVRWTRLLVRIRVLGNADFLDGPTIDELREGAGDGPVVLVHSSAWRSDALILAPAAPPAEPVAVVRLPDLIAEDAVARAQRLQDALAALREPGDDPFAAFGAQENAQSELHDSLEWLWDTVAAPRSSTGRLLHHLHPARSCPGPDPPVGVPDRGHLVAALPQTPGAEPRGHTEKEAARVAELLRPAGPAIPYSPARPPPRSPCSTPTPSWTSATAASPPPPAGPRTSTPGSDLVPGCRRAGHGVPRGRARRAASGSTRPYQRCGAALEMLVALLRVADDRMGA